METGVGGLFGPRPRPLTMGVRERGRGPNRKEGWWCTGERCIRTGRWWVQKEWTEVGGRERQRRRRALAGCREARSVEDGGDGWLVSAVVARVVRAARACAVACSAAVSDTASGHGVVADEDGRRDHVDISGGAAAFAWRSDRRPAHRGSSCQANGAAPAWRPTSLPPRSASDVRRAAASLLQRRVTNDTRQVARTGASAPAQPPFRRLRWPDGRA